MAQKFYDGNVLSMVATSAVAVGEVIPFDDTIGVSQNDAKIGEIVTIDTEGVYGFDAKASTDFAVGERVTFDTTAKTIGDDAVGAGFVNAGTVWETYSSATGDGIVYVKING